MTRTTTISHVQRIAQRGTNILEGGCSKLLRSRSLSPRLIGSAYQKNILKGEVTPCSSSVTYVPARGYHKQSCSSVEKSVKCKTAVTQKAEASTLAPKVKKAPKYESQHKAESERCGQRQHVQCESAEANGNGMSKFSTRNIIYYIKTHSLC